MSKVRVLVGTRKGAFILTSDGKREKWEVSGPHFAGWEIYHLKGSPVDPNRIYASQTSGWFGQVIQRSDDGGKTWHQPGTPPGEDHRRPRHAQGREQQVRLRHFSRDRQAADHAPVVRRHAASVGVQARVASGAVAHDPDTVYAGVEDAAMFRSTDGGEELAGTFRPARPRHRSQVAAGRRRHGPAHDHSRSEESEAHLHRDFAAGAFRTDDGGADVEADQPRPALAVHSGSRTPRSATACIASPCIPSRPDVLFMQKHWDVMRSDDAGDKWHEVSGNLPTDFGFRSTCTRTNRKRSTSCRSRATREHFPPDGKLRVYRSRTGGNEWEPLTNGLPQKNCYVNVLRDAMAVDSLDPCGIYFGTTGGQVYASADGGDSWSADCARSAGGAVGGGADAGGEIERRIGRCLFWTE